MINARDYIRWNIYNLGIETHGFCYSAPDFVDGGISRYLVSLS